jgi:hypothetical protein
MPCSLHRAMLECGISGAKFRRWGRAIWRPTIICTRWAMADAMALRWISSSWWRDHRFHAHRSRVLLQSDIGVPERSLRQNCLPVTSVFSALLTVEASITSIHPLVIITIVTAFLTSGVWSTGDDKLDFWTVSSTWSRGERGTAAIFRWRSRKCYLCQ